jgi:hypothetical protein
MRKRNSTWKEMATMDEARVFGYCRCCENEVTDEKKEYYINENGEVFCDIECVLEHYGVIKVEA